MQWNLGMMALALAPVLAPGVALADARDDVVAGMMRCAVITDDRQWLDCYYGAAQPMRGHLGLSPAPQSQQQLLQGGVHVAAPVQPAYNRSTSLAAPAVRSGPPPMPKRSGLLDVFGGSDVVSNMPLKDYDFGSGGALRVTLQDGQVWEQTPADAASNPAHPTDTAQSIHVTISQGAMHTFNLVLGDGSQHYKVTRIK